jgi:dTDP-4-amino-4,6-dideoxygalactose transaminase
VSKWRIPLSDLDYGMAEEDAVLRVLRSKWLSMGAEVEAFESEFADSIGSRYALAVTNGTAALQLAYLALGVGPGDEVIQPAINFVAAANMTVATGATPVFADIVGIDEPTIDPADISRRITARTKAVVVMNFGGYMPRMSGISEICRNHGLALIEDACHAVGAHYVDPEQKPPHGRMAGNLGDIGCFSFFSNKNMAVGEGGMVTTDNENLARQVRLLRSHGMTTLTWDRHQGHADSYNVQLHGLNCRLDEIHAALGRTQLRKLANNNERRKHLVSHYRTQLSGLSGWIVPFENYQGSSAYHLAVVLAPDADHRSRVVRALKEARIQTSLHYPYIPGFEAFGSFQADGLERSKAYVQRTITLPLFPGMTESQVEEVCSVIMSSSQPMVKAQ